jgi:hypothetical protein
MQKGAGPRRVVSAEHLVMFFRSEASADHRRRPLRSSHLPQLQRPEAASEARGMARRRDG